MAKKTIKSERSVRMNKNMLKERERNLTKKKTKPAKEINSRMGAKGDKELVHTIIKMQADKSKPHGWIITNLERSRVRYMAPGGNKPSWGRALDAGILFWPLTYSRKEATKELEKYCEEYRFQMKDYRIEQFPADGKHRDE